MNWCDFQETLEKKKSVHNVVRYILCKKWEDFKYNDLSLQTEAQQGKLASCKRGGGAGWFYTFWVVWNLGSMLIVCVF